MKKYNGGHISEIDILKIIIILKLLHIYYSYEERIDRKKVDGNSGSEKNSDKNINSNNTTHIINTENKFSEVNIELPVLISEQTISIPIEHTIQLKDFILGVKNVKNHVYLTDYKVFPLIHPNNKINLFKGKIFIKGQLKSTVEYSSIDEISKNSVSGYLRYTTSIIPFECTALINYSHIPIFNKINIENSKEKIHCSIKEAEVYVSNKYSEMKSISNIYDLGKSIKEINQKIILKITICLTQRQEIKMLRKNN